MDKLIDLISSNENWLMQRILDYAKANDYTKYASTLVEAWRLSISGLSESFVEGLKKYNGIPDLGPDEDYSKDPIAAFGILEAQRHRSRGVTLSMFLGLMKYYRQSYIDLISESDFDNNDKNKYLIYINRFFDRLEIGFSSEWSELGEKKIIEDLQSKNRDMTNEKNKYLTIFDSLNAPMFFVNEKNIIENLNHATSEYFEFYKTSGEKYYEISKKEIELYFIKDEIKAFTLSKKEKSEFEKLIPTKKGLCYFQVKMKRMLDVSGKFFGTVVILNDLTELKNTSESLKQSEERYKNIVKDQTEFITRFTPDGIHTFVNDAYCNYMKMKRDELIGKSFFSFLPEEDYKKLKSLLESLTFTNPIKEIEHRYIIEGKPRFLHWTNRAIFDYGGNLIEYQAVGRDITDKKLIEDELRKKKEELFSIFENSSVGIDLVDSKGNFLEVNSKLAELLGYTTEELLKLNINDVTHPEDIELSKNEFIPLFENKKTSYKIEKRYLKKDGSYFWADLSVTPIKNDLGQIVAVTGVIQDITERKISEERLKSKNKELENIIEFLPDATFIIDKDDKIIAWNHAIEEMTGILKKDMIGKEHIYVSIPFYGKPRRQLIDILFDKNSDIVSKYNFIKTKGDIIYAEVFTPALYNNKGAYVWAIAAPLYDNEGNKVGAIESIRDITYQKRAEETLLKEKEFVNTLVQASPAFYVAMNSEGKVLLMNNSMLSSLGYELDEVIGVDYISTFVPKEDKEYLTQTFDNLIKSKVPTINENNILTKDGKKILVEWHGRSILKEDGTFDFFFGVGLDITEKNKFQKALKESEEKYRELVENANSIILKFDNEGRIISMNEFGLKFFGYSEDELIGKFGIGTIVPEIESTGKELKKLIKDMINFESEYNININENMKKNGERVWVYWTNKPIRDEKGNIKGIFCVGTDITERKKAEDKINELNETLRILNKILRHDILNDLTIVLTVCDLMGDSNPRLKEKASRALDKSITLIERMRELEQALISDSPIQKYEIDQVILDIIKNYPETKFNVSGKCKICTDEAIFSVIDNIIRNAIIHGKTKRIDIEIRQTEKYCIVKIADYGIGIPEEIKTRIFEEGFSYGDNRSTGLGLYIVKKIMERYGGSIKVSDNKPTGAIFILEYPVCSSKNKIC